MVVFFHWNSVILEHFESRNIFKSNSDPENQNWTTVFPEISMPTVDSLQTPLYTVDRFCNFKTEDYRVFLSMSIQAPGALCIVIQSNLTSDLVLKWSVNFSIIQLTQKLSASILIIIIIFFFVNSVSFFKEPHRFTFQRWTNLITQQTPLLACIVPAVDNLIKLYFAIGFGSKKILMILTQNHHILISIVTLKRHEWSLYRRKPHTDLGEVVAFVHQELKRNGQMQR